MTQKKEKNSPKQRKQQKQHKQQKRQEQTIDILTTNNDDRADGSEIEENDERISDITKTTNTHTQIKDILNTDSMLNVHMTAREIALSIGFSKAKDVEPYLKELLEKNVVIKSKTKGQILWSFNKLQSYISSTEEKNTNSISGTHDIVADKTDDDENTTKSNEVNINHSSAANLILEEKVLPVLQAMIDKQDEEILFLRNELKVKNEQISSLHHSIELPINDDHN